MVNKIINIIKHLLYAIISNVLYAFVIYYAYIWLVGYSLLYAYLGNLGIIIIALTFDELTFKYFQSKKIVKQIKKEKDIKKAYYTIQSFLDSFISFKTILYLFYIFILIASQIIDFYPTLINENLVNFILANRYSILILIAFDRLIAQFSNEKRRIKEITAKLKKDLIENQD
jgi:hypothetical protein